MVFINYHEFKRTIGIREIMRVCGVDMSHYSERNSRLRGPCPCPEHPTGHSGKYRNKEQFVVDRRDRDYDLARCFAPDCPFEGGDAIAFAKAMTGLDDQHLRYWIDKHFGSQLSSGPRRSDRTAKEKKKGPTKSASRRETSTSPLRPLRWSYKGLIADCPYLREQRGLSLATVERFKIGLCHKPGKMMDGRIAIPIWLPEQSDDENPVAYLGRAVDAGLEPRYLFPENFPRNQIVYNLGPAVRDSEEGAPILIVEGVFKALHIFEQLAVPNVVATFGASLGEGQTRRLIETQRPLVLFWDGDARDKARKACAQLIKEAFVRVVMLDNDVEPDHLDADDLQGLLSFML